MDPKPPNYYGTPAKATKHPGAIASSSRKTKGPEFVKLTNPLESGNKSPWSKDKSASLKPRFPDLNTKGKPADLVQQHQAQAGECVRNLYTHDQLTDVLIVIDKYKFSAHKAVLMTYSEYFKRVLASTDPQARTEIEICGIPSTAFESILQYMYTAEIFLKMENIGNIHTAAKQLIMDKLLEDCERMVENFNAHDALVILHTSYKKDSELCQRAFYILISKFMEVIDTPGLAMLEMDMFMMFLLCDDLVVGTEMDVFRAAMNWIRFDFVPRQDYVNEVLLQIRFTYMTPLELLFSSEMIEDLDTDLEHDLLEAMWYGVAGMYKREANAPRALKPRRRYLNVPDYGGLVVPTPKDVIEIDQNVDKVILVVGGVPADATCNMEDIGKAIFSYIPEENEWKKVGQLPEARHLHAVQVLGDCLYVMGGSRPLDTFESCPFPTATVSKWDLRTRKWTQCADMKHRRIHHSGATVNNKIYILAGQTDRGRLLTSVEAYTPSLDRWEEVTPLTVGRIGMAVAVYNGNIMVAGGYEDVCTNSSGKHVMNKVEVYDPQSNSWSFQSDLPAARCHASLVVVNGELYMCGGAKRSTDSDKKTVVASVSNVDKYSPERDEWVKFRSLKYRRHGARAAAIGTKVYLIGGVSSIEEGPINKVESMDMTTGAGTSSNLACPAQMGMGVALCDAKLMEGTYITPDKRTTAMF